MGYIQGMIILFPTSNIESLFVIWFTSLISSSLWHVRTHDAFKSMRFSVQCYTAIFSCMKHYGSHGASGCPQREISCINQARSQSISRDAYKKFEPGDKIFLGVDRSPVQTHTVCQCPTHQTLGVAETKCLVVTINAQEWYALQSTYRGINSHIWMRPSQRIVCDDSVFMCKRYSNIDVMLYGVQLAKGQGSQQILQHLWIPRARVNGQGSFFQRILAAPQKYHVT